MKIFGNKLKNKKGILTIILSVIVLISAVCGVLKKTTIRKRGKLYYEAI